MIGIGLKMRKMRRIILKKISGSEELHSLDLFHTNVVNRLLDGLNKENAQSQQERY